MPTPDRLSIKSLISRVIAYAESKNVCDESQFKLFSRFIRLFYAHASVADLYHRPLEELFGMVQSHWQLMCACDSESVSNQMRVFNPDPERDGWQSTHTIIELVSKDMPFIVDSMRMEITRLGFSVHQMIFMGGMKISRDAKGAVTNVAPYHAPDKSGDMKTEAPVYMEIDRQTDPEILAMIHKSLVRVLSDVQATVADWSDMQARVHESIDYLAHAQSSLLSKDEVDESIAFLKWLLNANFTFLGMRDYEITGKGDKLALRLIKKSGLGVLRDEENTKVYRQFSNLPEPARELMLSPRQLLVISKTNTLSTVHRHAYTDYIGVKQFNEKGELIGERRIIGLYTSAAYNSQPKNVPFLRHKVVSVMKKSGFPPKSHAGKDLMHILETFPRDDLFQGSTNELYHIAVGILNLQERRKLSLFVREDAYGRYVSCLVFVPRDNFNSQLILRIQSVLMSAFDGVESSYSSYFYTPVLTRIHYTIRVPARKKLRYKLSALEAELIEAAKSWQDGLRECAFESFGEERANTLLQKYNNAFPASYRESFAPRQAVLDMDYIESLPSDILLGMNLYRPTTADVYEIKFKLFRYEQTMPLSDALPILENMGLRVIGEAPYELSFADKSCLWINDFSMLLPNKTLSALDKVRDIFQEAFYQVWLGEAENDALNALVLEAELNCREISLLRGYVKYLKQAGFTYSFDYMAQAFVKYPGIAKHLVHYFHQRFSPFVQRKQKKDALSHLEKRIHKNIDDVLLLDEDRIFRRVLSVMKATLRTNFYQKTEDGKAKSHITFKLSPKEIPELPLPLPKYEIFVYSPRFEGVHLRAAKVARGGLRWSDRREDFRTEVLGLMKAQQVKNAVIVPEGAKGGFVPKHLPLDGPREAIQKEAIACYSGFIQGLLDITDNMDGSTTIVPPKNVVCYDDDDAYLVVAADKGTATFSDIANAIAIKNNFWLGDAFASGGSTGYDHKKMGITAKGAWVSAQRHFQGLGINLETTEISVVGIGDMSGDVFGNGMLLSEHLKLVCAFNHMHIFIDPNPNPKASFRERKRLFDMPRSAWTDYQPDLISTGGGVYSRAAKSIPISAQVKALLGIDEDHMVPNDLIRAILKAPVDMIWNGGIGTYVKSSVESNSIVGDRANDALRVNANELQTRVVVEGGNLGLTQLARIEYALAGGLINTDFIDNSAGVDCSDHEVNIKILLNSIMSAGKMTERARNNLLVSMTDEVSSLVLKNNYEQNQTVSMLASLAPQHMNHYIRFIKMHEDAGKLNRELEYLPDNNGLLERRANNQGLTAPEIAVLLSYSKIILKDEIKHSELITDAALQPYLMRAFPKVLRKKYRDYILSHRLHHEILATQLCNEIVSQMGVTFVYQMMDETGASANAIVRAFISAYEIFHVSEIHEAIESLDYQVDVAIQYQMLNEVTRLVRRATRWLLHSWREHIDIAKTIAHFEPHVKSLFKRLPRLLLGSDKAYLEKQHQRLVDAGVPNELALRMAGTRMVYHALNIICTATSEDVEVYRVAKIYFMLVDRLDLHWFRDKINDHPVTHRWSVLAKAAFKADLDWIQRELVMGVVRFDVTAKSISAKINAWLQCHRELLGRWQAILTDLRSEDVTDFSIISVAIRELFDLAKACNEQELLAK